MIMFQCKQYCKATKQYLKPDGWWSNTVIVTIDETIDEQLVVILLLQAQFE